MTDNGSRYVSWRQLTFTVVACMGTVAGAVAWAWEVHTSGPHPGALSQDEFKRHADNVSDRLKRMEQSLEKSLDRIYAKLDGMK